jgi:organic radical activating enzyme
MTIAREMQDFMLWRRGKFIRPQDRDQHYSEILLHTIDDYYQRDKFIAPQIQFAVTTRCTLRCRDCNALIPHFHDTKHFAYDFITFKNDFEILLEAFDGIQRFCLLGGEPLLNPDLPAMLMLCATTDKVKNVEIVTNGTLLPSAELLAAMAECSDKVWFHLSNYSANQNLQNILKYKQIIAILKDRGLKYQLSSNLLWSKDSAWVDQKYSHSVLKDVFALCWFKGCVQILNGKLSTCPRISSGYELGLAKSAQHDFIDLRKCHLGERSDVLRQELIDFYHKDYFEACRYCSHGEERIMPAIQMKRYVTTESLPMACSGEQ